MMAIESHDRRRLLRHLLLSSAGLAAMSLPGLAQALTSPSQRLLVPGRLRTQWALAVFDPQSLEMQAVIPLPARAHGVLRDPLRPRQLLVFARRPGTAIWRVDLQRRAVVATCTTAADRHLFGHGCWSASGRQLYVSENNIENGSGVISVRDSRSLAVLNEFPSAGIGPHELMLSTDRRSLIVANGGILTLPEAGRVKLNRHSMRPSLDLLDPASGTLLQRHTLDNHLLSMRHLATWPGGIAVAMQYEGPPGDDAPLLAILREGGPLQPVEAPAGGWASLGAYAASVVCSGQRLLLSCPKAGVIASWSCGGAFTGVQALPGVAALAAPEGRLWAASDSGAVLTENLAPADPTRLNFADWQWDNHAYLL